MNDNKQQNPYRVQPDLFPETMRSIDYITIGALSVVVIGFLGYLLYLFW